MKVRTQTLARVPHGFTLLELLVVVAIIGILAAIAIPQLLGAQEKAKKSSCEDAFTILNSTVLNKMETYLAVADPYPAQRAIDDTMADVQARAAKNPRNMSDAGYDLVAPSYSFVPSPDTTCKVFLYDGTLLTSAPTPIPSVVVTQFERVVRSYRLVLN